MTLSTHPRRAITALPINMLFGSHDDVSKNLGFVFGEPLDDLFRAVEAPPGWTIENTVQPQWLTLRDPQGRRRGSVFHKAAFHDRQADWHLVRRYVVQQYLEGGQLLAIRVIDTASGKAVHVTGTVGPQPAICDPREAWREYHQGVDRLMENARQWLDTTYPDHANVFAYWEAP